VSLQHLHGASDEMGHTFSKSLRVACIPKSVKTDSHFATDKSLSRNHFMPEACATTCPGINSLLFFRSSNLCRCSTCTARAMRWDIHYRNPCVLHPKKNVKTDSHFATDMSLSRNHSLAEACATTCPEITSLLSFRSSNLCRCSTCTARAMRWDIYSRNACVLRPKNSENGQPLCN